jgi:RNA polymerase sigma-70 factor (ECF subfamily)
VVQEALLELVRQPSPPQRVVPWLYRVVRNRAISAGRSGRRRKKREERLAADQDSWFVPDPGARLDAETASAALAALPIEQRETIVAHLWGGLSFEEIAEVTHTSSSTAHRRYQAGLAALRDRLEAKSITRDTAETSL